MKRTSPYTTALLDELAKVDASLWDALSATSMRVNRESKGQQRPFISSDMNGDLYLGHRSPTRRQRGLVIAVGRFEHISEMSFKGVYHDQEAWAGFLRAHGFDVTELRDPPLARMREALEALKVASSGVEPPRIVRVGVGPVESGAKGEAEARQAPADSLLWVFYAGFGFLSGAERYLAGADAQPGKTKDGTDPMARSSLAVAELEKRVRERAAASVLVYDTQFL